MRDFRDAKAMARTLRQGLAAKDTNITNSEALELTARMLGERDWNTLAAAIEASRHRDAVWTRLEGAQAQKQPVTGKIVARVRGGFTVDLGGASAFLPGTQLDVRPVRDRAALMGREHRFAILKLDRRASAIVVSRRAVLAEAVAAS